MATGSAQTVFRGRLGTPRASCSWR
jgi:hypothetical protein